MRPLRRILFVLRFAWRPVTGPVPGEAPWSLSEWWSVCMPITTAWELSGMLEERPSP